jgi:hypothetical protein
MKYSRIHRQVAEYDAIDRDEILNEPENYFGPNYQTVLNFWWLVESLQEEHLEKITELYDKEFEISNFDGEIRLLNIAEQRIDQDFLSSAIGDCIWEEIPHSDYSIRQSSHGAIFHATCELIAMDIIFERGEVLVYVPMFDFTKEETKEQTKEEPPLSHMIEVSMPTGEIFNMRMVRPPYTPNGMLIGEWISPITHNYYLRTHQE